MNRMLIAVSKPNSFFRKSNYSGDVWSLEKDGHIESYRVGNSKNPSQNTLEGIARQFGILQRIPLISLVDNTGFLEGDSDESDNSPEFFKRVKGLDINSFRPDGKAPPILVVKIKGELFVADGRHRILGFIQKLKENNYDWKKENILGYILNRDDPKTEKAMQLALEN